MIGSVLAVVTELVVTPQTTEDVAPDRRLWLDLDVAPIDAQPQTVEVIAVSSTPVAYAIPHEVTYAHDVDVVVTVEHGDQAAAFRLRDDVVSDLAGRALIADWPNATWSGQEFVRMTGPTVRYAEGTTEDPQTLAAYAVLTFTVETTVRP